MTDKEKAKAISHTDCEYEVALEMAEFKDEEYRKEFNVPDYCESFEEIANYIGNDIYSKGYNKARAYDESRFKEIIEEELGTLRDSRDIYPRMSSGYIKYDDRIKTINEIVKKYLGDA